MKVNIGKTIELDVDASALPANVMEHVVYIGLRNILMDSHASITKESDGDDYIEKARAVAEKKLAGMMAGEIRLTGTREGDPVRAEAIRIQTDRLRVALRKAGRKVADIDPKALREKAVATITPEVMALAKKRVEEARNAADVDIAGL